MLTIVRSSRIERRALFSALLSISTYQIFSTYQIIWTTFFLGQNDRAVGGEVEFADHAIFNAIRSVAELIL